MQAVKKAKHKAHISASKCVACGACAKVCPREAIKIRFGVYAQVNQEDCIGCRKCAQTCPTSIIEMRALHEEA